MIYNPKYSKNGLENLKEFLVSNNIDESNLNIIENIEASEMRSQSLYMFLNSEVNFILPEGLIIKKILNYMFLLNKFVTTKLKMEITVTTKVEKLIKSIILNPKKIYIINSRHLDQITLCCIISVLNYYKKFYSGGKSGEIFGKVVDR